MKSLQLEARIGHQVGPSEKALLVYLAENRNKRHGEIVEALNEDKGNITNRLNKLEEKELVMSIRTFTPRINEIWSLTPDGVAFVILNMDMKIDIDKILTLYSDVDENTKIFYAMKEGLKAVKFHSYEKVVRDIIYRFALELYDEEYAKSKHTTNDDNKYISKQENTNNFVAVTAYVAVKYFSRMSLKDRKKYNAKVMSILGEEYVKKNFARARPLIDQLLEY